MGEMKERYENGLSNLLNKYPEHSFVIVTHGFGVQILTQMLNEDLLIVDCPHCSITHFSIEQDDFINKKLTDNSHLKFEN